MATLKEIKSRIQGVRNTQKITRAMKIVATTRLKKLEKTVQSGFESMGILKSIYENLAKSAYDFTHPLIQQNEASKKAGVIVISSDRGLCGAFNALLFRTIEEFAENELGNSDCVYYLIGTKALSNYKKRRPDAVVYSATKVTFGQHAKIANEIIDHAVAAYAKNEISDLYVIFNGYRSRSDYGFTVHHLLPFQQMHATMDMETKRAGTRFLVEPSASACLSVLIPLYMGTVLESALLQSQTAEELSRMLAMDYATENANELVADLTLVYNRTRQAVITKEISEIVGGAEALK